MQCEVNLILMQINILVLKTASALDPRFKELPYLEKEDKEQVYTKLLLEAQESYQVPHLCSALSFVLSQLSSVLYIPLIFCAQFYRAEMLTVHTFLHS